MELDNYIEWEKVAAPTYTSKFKQTNSQICTLYFTILSCPALASIFPSEEKWQATTLLLLVRMQPNSLNIKPNREMQNMLMVIW